MRKRVNVLVVALVLVLASGLVMAAVPKVRHAAARTECTHNLKHLGLALELLHDNYKSYPAGTIPVKDPVYPAIGLPPEKRLSWLVLIQYLDQEIHPIDRTKGWDAPENLVDAHGESSNFRCPLSPGTAEPGFPGLTHYVGVAGVGTDAPGRSAGSSGIGVFGHDRQTRHTDIKDGAATTMMVVETTWKNGPWTAGGHPTVRGLDPSGRPYLSASGQFGSNHRCDGLLALTPSYGTNVLFVDGSIRCLTSSIKPELFEALATIAGGEAVDF
jgi:prepilin-type processing-associated H-X9-DG protein